MKGVNDRLADRQMQLTITPAAEQWLADKGYDPAFGARPLKRVIQREVQDPLADKLLLVTAYVMLAIPNLRLGLVIPAWVTALVITRDVVIVVVALVMHLAVGISRFPPSPLSKINTAAQLLAIVGVLLSSRSSVFEAIAGFLVLLVAALTIGSGIEYIYRANRMAAQRE